MVCDKKVIFCSTIFKNEGYLHKSFDNIKLLSQLFSKVKILICYDYSGDKSLLELLRIMTNQEGTQKTFSDEQILNAIKESKIEK